MSEIAPPSLPAARLLRPPPKLTLVPTPQPKQPLVLQLTAGTHAAIAMASHASGAATADIVERAWRNGRRDVATWQRVPSVSTAKAPQTFLLDASVVAELQAEAGRLDVSVSNLFEAVWRAARDGDGGRGLN
jgi:hypothetical protein